jgi:transcription-repair coupling factor (superfamily II helicase)
MDILLNLIQKSRKIKQLLTDDKKLLSIKTLHGSLKSLVAFSLLKEKYDKILIVANETNINDYYHDLNLLSSNKLAYLVEPIRNSKLKEFDTDDHLGWLIEGLSLFTKNEKVIALTNSNIFNQPVPNLNEITTNRIKVSKNETIKFGNFTQNLFLSGFERKDYVSEEGEVSIRGGIVDIYPIGFINPIRIEFWGDEIDSIREFETISQRSIKEYTEIEFISKVFHDANTKANESIFNYLDNNTLIILDSPQSLNIDEDIKEEINKYNRILLNDFGEADYVFKSESHPVINGEISILKDTIIKLEESSLNVIVSSESKIHQNRIKDILHQSINNEYEVKIKWLDTTLSGGFISEDFGIAYLTEHQIFNRMRFVDTKKSKKSKGLTLKEVQELRLNDIVVHEDKGVCRFEGFKSVKIGDSEQDCLRLVFDGGDVLYVNLNYIHKIQKYSAGEEIVPRLSKLGSSEWSRKVDKTKKRLKDISRDLIKLYANRKNQIGHAFQEDNIWQKEFEAGFMYEDTIDQARSTEDVKKDMESPQPMDRLVCGDVGFGKTEVAIRAAFKAVQGNKQVAVLVPTTVLAQQHYMTFKDRLSRYPVNVDLLSRFRSTKEQKDTLQKLKEGKIDILVGTHRLLSQDVIYKDIGLLIVDEEHRFGVGSKEKLKMLKSNLDTLTLTATPIPRTLNFSLLGARDLSLMETPPRNRLPIITEVDEFNLNEIQKFIEQEVKRAGQVFFVNDKIEPLSKYMLDMKMLMPRYTFEIAHGQMTPNELERIMQKFVSGKIDVLLTTKIVESGLDIPKANTIIINNAQNFGLAELYQLRGRVGRSNIQAYCLLLIPQARSLNQIALKRLQAIEELNDLGSGYKLALKDLEIRGAGNLLGAEQSGFIHDIGFELYQKLIEEAVIEIKYDEFKGMFEIDDVVKRKMIENKEVAIEISSDAFIPKNYISNESERFGYYKRLYTIRENKELEDIQKELIDRFGKLPSELQNLLFVVKVRVSAVATGFERIIIKNNKMVCELPNKSKSNYYDEVFPAILDFLEGVENGKFIQQKERLTLEFELESQQHSLEILWKLRKTIETIYE